MKPLHANPLSERRGAATVFMAVTVVGLGAMSLGLLAINLSVEKEQRSSQRQLAAFYAAEAGLSQAFQELLNGNNGDVGSAQAPVQYGNAAFFVESTSMGGFQTSLVATGMADGGVSRTELVVTREATGLFQHAAFGDKGLLLNSAALIDSYRSSLGSYASQYNGGDGFAGMMGNVASNFDVVLEANTMIAGDVSPGPTGILDDNAPQTQILGTTAPLLSEITIPEITVPSFSASPSITTLVDTVVPPGEYYFPSIQVNVGKTLTVVGPATIVTDGLNMLSNTNMVLDASLGPIEFYSTGDFSLPSNATLTTYSDTALDVSVFLTADNWGDGDDGSEIKLNANAAFVGTVYAPNAYVSVHSNFEIFGGVMADFVELSSNSMVHYDVDLAAGAGGTLQFETLLWRPLGN